MTALDTSTLPFEETALHVPALEEVQSVLQNYLKNNFHDVKVEVIDCPDLKLSPYHLANSGLCGSPALIEVGGPPYLLPNVDLTKIYNIPEILRKSYEGKKCNLFAIGAGAGPYPLRNTNCEGIFNLNIDQKNDLLNMSYTAKVQEQNEDCVLEKVPIHEDRCALLLNLFACEGKPGKILKIHCKKRIGNQNYIESIRLGLTEYYKEKTVGLGGIFILKQGNVKQHVMRDFSKTPIRTEDELNTWLKFYEMPATLNALGTLVTRDCGLDLRLQHFHSFSNKNWGGHYHYDTTPDTVEYEGYFNIAERIIRVDKPKITHQFGRD